MWARWAHMVSSLWEKPAQQSTGADAAGQQKIRLKSLDNVNVNVLADCSGVMLNLKDANTPNTTNAR